MKVRLLGILLLIAGFFILTPLVHSQTNFRSGNNPNLMTSEVIDSDYFAAGDTVSLQGTVNGDAYLAGGNINVTGTVNGDLLAAGGNINISGTVTGNIRTAGGTILLNGKTGRSLTAAGGNINLSPEASIGGSAVVAGGNISLLGPITKGLTIGGGEVTIGNQIGGDINAGVGKLSFIPNAKVNGNLTYWSENAAAIDQQASISGRITQNVPPKKQPTPEHQRQAALAGVITFFKLISFIISLIAGFLLLWLFPVFTQKTTSTLTEHPLLSFGIGFLALALTPITLLILLITLVGIPFGLIWLITLIFDMWIAKIFVSILIGVWLLKLVNQKTSIYLAFLVGLVIYYLITLIPIIGWLIGFGTALAGLGALIITKRNYYLELRRKEII